MAGAQSGADAVALAVAQQARGVLVGGPVDRDVVAIGGPGHAGDGGRAADRGAGVVHPIAVLVDAVVPDLGGAWVDRGVAVVAVTIGGGPAVAVTVGGGHTVGVDGRCHVDEAIAGVDVVAALAEVDGGVDEHGADLDGAGTQAGQQGGRPSHVGGGHGGALPEVVAPVRVDGLLQDAVGVAVAVGVGGGVATWSHQLDVAALVGVACASTEVVGGAYAHHGGVGGRVVDGASPVVAGGGDHEYARSLGVVAGGLLGAGAAAGAQGHVDDVGAVVGGPDDAVDDVGAVARTGSVEHLDRHDAGPEGDAAHHPRGAIATPEIPRAASASPRTTPPPRPA